MTFGEYAVLTTVRFILSELTNKIDYWVRYEHSEQPPKIEGDYLYFIQMLTAKIVAKKLSKELVMGIWEQLAYYEYDRMVEVEVAREGDALDEGITEEYRRRKIERLEKATPLPKALTTLLEIIEVSPAWEKTAAEAYAEKINEMSGMWDTTMQAGAHRRARIMRERANGRPW